MSLAKDRCFCVRVCKHPIDRSPISVDHYDVLYRSKSLQQIKEAFCKTENAILVVNGKEILKDQWKRKRAKIGDTVDIIPVVGIFPFFIFWTTTSLFWATVSTVVVNLALGFAFSYLGGLLFGQDYKESDDSGGSQNYSWNPRTTHREGIPRGRLYGEAMVHGNVIASWTDVENNNEVLYAIVDHGEGPIQGLGSNITYLNDQPSGNFTGVTVQERLGTMNQTCMTGFEKTKVEYPLNWVLTSAGGAQTFTTPNNWFDDLEFTVAFPNGLIYYHKDGESSSQAVQIKVEVSERGLNSWTTAYNASISAETRIPFYRNIKLSELTPPFVCTRGKQYDIRFTRMTGDDTERHISNCHIKSIREVADVAFTRPGRALIGVKSVGSDQLSGSLDIKCIRQGRIVNVYNGTTWNLQYSNNRAWVELDMITLPVITGTGESGDPYVIDYYEGLDPSNVDLAFSYEWAEWCDDLVPDGKGSTEPRMVCNYYLDEKRSLFSLAYEIAQIGRAKLCWDGTILTGWLDTSVTSEIDLVTMDNIMAGSWKNAWNGKDEMAGSILVSYTDEDKGYERVSYPHSNANSGNYARVISIESSGETRFSGVVRAAHYALLRNQLIRNVNSFEMLKDAMRYKLGDVIRLQHSTPNWGHHYRVVDTESDGQTITVDRDATDVSSGDKLYVRTFDDTSGIEDIAVDEYIVDSVSGHTITITGSFDPLPTKNCIVATGSPDSGSTETPILRRIVKIVPRVDNFYEITVETYDAALYDSDMNDPNNPNPDYIWPAPAKKDSLNNLPITWGNILDAINSVMPPQPNIDIPWMSNVDWDGDSASTVTWSAREVDDPILFRYRGETYEITPDSSTKEFIYWDPDYTTQFRSTDVLEEAVAPGHWVVCINEDGTAYPANPYQLIHAGLLLAGTLRAETYVELRQTMAFTGNDSCDATHPFTLDFKVPSEMTSIISVLLSFKIRAFRAYSTGVASGGGSTSGAGGGTTVTSESSGGTSGAGGGTTVTSASGGGQTSSESLTSGYSTQTAQAGGTSDDTESVNCGGTYHTHYWEEDYPGHSHDLDDISHSHTVSNHTHDVTLSNHTHNIGTHTHDVTLSNHTHTTPNHTHTLSFGIYETSPAVNVHIHIDNGSGYGAQFGPSYSADQIDIDIASVISGVGWKSVRFDVDALCRIVGIVEMKVDITA